MARTATKGPKKVTPKKATRSPTPKAKTQVKRANRQLKAYFENLESSAALMREKQLGLSGRSIRIIARTTAQKLVKLGLVANIADREIDAKEVIQKAIERALELANK